VFAGVGRTYYVVFGKHPCRPPLDYCLIELSFTPEAFVVCPDLAGELRIPLQVQAVCMLKCAFWEAGTMELFDYCVTEL
jgi:hypothetical protein